MTFRHGMNMTGWNYYSTDYPFVNSALLGQYNPSTIKTDPVTGDIAQAGSYQILLPGLDGTHQYTVHVTGAVSATVSGVTQKFDANNKIRFTRTIDPANSSAQSILLSVKTTDANTTAGHLQVYRTEHESLLQSNPYAWDPDFLASVKGFSPKRFMEWQMTNNSAITTQRPKPNSHLNGAGAPVELMADLCNQDQSDMWMNIPHLATDDLAREMISVANKILGPKQTLYVEYSNEVWNATFTQYKYADAQAKLHYGAAYKQYMSCDNWYGYRSGQIAKIAASISPRAKVILATQMGSNTSKWERVLAGYHESGATNTMLGAIAEAPYLFTTSSLATQVQWAIDGNYDALHNELVATMNVKKPWFATIKAYADSLGVPLFLYEYNISIDAFRVADATQKAQLVAFQQNYAHSQRCADLIKQHALNFVQAGGSAGCFFNHAGKGSQYGEWGARPSTQATYPLYEWLRQPLQNWIPGYVPPTIGATVGTVTPTNNSGPIVGTLKQ